MFKVAAYGYDWGMRRVEDAGLYRWRADLVGRVSGDVLEIGAGTGRNVALYPSQLSRLVLTEPDANMRAHLIRKLTDRRDVELETFAAEKLCFDDGSFDWVVSTLVLCSVADLKQSLAEVHRVLRPGGRLAFIEHVAASERPDLLGWQRRIEPLWRRVAGNCHLTRATEDAIAQSGFELVEITRESMRKVPGIVRPTVRGVARSIS
ncbi:MAG: methyltransferase domain-containing protein [Actinobacteria bacterium]|nr:methyltransferase domain-containing protein [Actinomycetota bacterium]